MTTKRTWHMKAMIWLSMVNNRCVVCETTQTILESFNDWYEWSTVAEMNSHLKDHHNLYFKDYNYKLCKIIWYEEEEENEEEQSPSFETEVVEENNNEEGGYDSDVTLPPYNIED